MKWSMIFSHGVEHDNLNMYLILLLKTSNRHRKQDCPYVILVIKQLLYTNIYAKTTAQYSYIISLKVQSSQLLFRAYNTLYTIIII